MSRPLDDMIAERVAAMTVAERKAHQQWERRWKLRHGIARRLTTWMLRIPVFGQLMYVFWNGLIAEGVSETCTPRWGAITFSFLNDGYNPTVRDAWNSMTSNEYGSLTGLIRRVPTQETK